MVTISLLQQQSASERLKGISWSSHVSDADPEFLSTLFRTLNYDQNVDVRLASVDALSRFAGIPGVSDGLIRALQRQESPLVQIALIDALVQLQARQSIDVLRHLEGLTFPEISRRMDRSQDSAEKLWVRGLARLRKVMGVAE